MKYAILLSLICLSMPTALFASHTVEEQHAFVRDALRAVMSAVNDNIAEPEMVGNFEDYSTWEGFLGAEGHGWTMEEKKSAFLWFLNTMGTNDFTSVSDMDKELTRIAIVQCRDLAFTNAVPALMSMGANPNGICRKDAIALAIQLGDLNEAMTTFVDSIITNVVSYSFRERGVVCGKFARKVYDLSKGNNYTNAVLCGLATTMLYRNRKVDVTGAKMLDTLFCEHYYGYVNSSNRLDYSCFVLDHVNCTPYDKRDFTSITNQLLSSGQPLPWINVGGQNHDE